MRRAGGEGIEKVGLWVKVLSSSDTNLSVLVSVTGHITTISTEVLFISTRHSTLTSSLVCVCTGVTVAGLRGVQVDVPPAVRRGDYALLRCLYDLEGDALYSVKWYIGRREFYRFTPRERPQLKVFPIQGLADLVVQVGV